jgi:ATP-dependent DNA ligase
MLAKRVGELPSGSTWIFEPKWDGFRALVFWDGDEILIQSRDEKPLNRYFPEVVDTLRAQLPPGCVLDGEIVIATKDGLDFDSLQLRLHPAASRVALLSKQSPASIVFFDLLCEERRDLRDEPFLVRRKHLESLLSAAKPPIHLTPTTTDRVVAADWFRRFEGAGLDGVMAKADSGSYEPDKRVMFKVKHERECDCVVAGFRWHKKGEKSMVGSLLLGLFDDSGALQHVGVCASFTEQKRLELVDFLSPYRKNALDGHPWRGWAEHASAPTEAGQRVPGGQSRWSQGKDLSWEPLRPELVVEVAYEHMQGARFRHMSQFRRWRMDKKPADCTYAQLEVIPPQELMEIFPERSLHGAKSD